MNSYLELFIRDGILLTIAVVAFVFSLLKRKPSTEPMPAVSPQSAEGKQS